MKIVILFLLAVFAYAPLQAQTADRDMISDAAHCIVHGDRNWLEKPLPKVAVIVSAVMDTISYPKQPHMIYSTACYLQRLGRQIFHQLS